MRKKIGVRDNGSNFSTLIYTAAVDQTLTFNYNCYLPQN